MKVIHLVTDPISPVVRSQVLDNLFDLIKEGVDIEVVFFLQLRHYLSTARQTRETLKELGIPFSVYPVPFQNKCLGRIIAFFFLLWTIKTKFKKKIIFHCRGLRSSRFALLVKKMINDKFVIYDVRGDYLAELEFIGVDKDKRDSFSEVELYCLNNVDRVLFVSEYLQKAIFSYYDLNDVPFDILYCTTSESKVKFKKEDRNRIRKELGYTDELIFIYSGSVGLWHCLDKVIEVFEIIASQNSDAHFLFLTNQKEKASAMVSDSSIDSRSKVVNVSSDEVGAWLSASDVAIIIRKNHPLNYSASPVKVAEYIINGLPLIISDAIKDYSKMIDESGAGLIITGEVLSSPTLLRKSLSHYDRKIWLENRNKFKGDSLKKLTRTYSVKKMLNIYTAL